MSIKRQMDKEDMVCRGRGGYITQPHKMIFVPFATTWMDLQNIMLSEISETKKDKYQRISLICGILKKINKQTKSRVIPINTDSKLMVATGRYVRWWIKWVKGSWKDRTAVMEGISHKHEKHSTGTMVSGIAILLYGDRRYSHLGWAQHKVQTC